MSNEHNATYFVHGAEDTNIPNPELSGAILTLQEHISAAQNVSDDPSFDAYKTQTIGHLRHVSFTFSTADDSPDYVHAPVLAGPYPLEPALRQKSKGETFLSIINTPNQIEQTPYVAEDLELLEVYRQRQYEIDRNVIANPNKSYADFSERLDTQGFDAEFPEFEPTLDYVLERISNGSDVQLACQNSAIATQLRENTLFALKTARFDANDQPRTPQYKEAIYAIETALEFLDVIQRSNGPTPDLYHSDRYEYYLHFLIAQKDHIMYPTITNIGATDLLKLRQVPIGITGVTTELNWVDGFPQTSYEFFHHDINHTRRMYQFFKEKSLELDISGPELSQRGEDLMRQMLLPAIKIIANDSEEIRQLKRTARMLLFEVVHEDALPVDRQTILDAMFRKPLARTPFERILGTTAVEYFMESGATTLAYAYRKLAHTFYDKPGKRMNVLGSEDLRNRYVVVDAAMHLYRALGGGEMSEEEAHERFEQLVSTDEGFPDAFFETVLDDIDTRQAEKNGDFGFFVALPKTAEETIQAVRVNSKQIVSLFGYSDLGYARPGLLARQLQEDLRSYDPNTTTVLIGATAAGIGCGYEIAKEMGFETAGIVSTKVLAHDGRFAADVDTIHLVRDTQWGGYLPGSTTPSPTTEAFVGASDALLSYGGGHNTAVALREATKRGGITVKHRPHAMSEESQSDQPYGEALRVWQELSLSTL